jgi:hypothetical protein
MIARAAAVCGGAALAAALAGCGGGKPEGCSNGDGALTRAAFVFVESPAAGDRVSSGFRVQGCSSTFEATVTWRLLARDGSRLAGGTLEGGGLEPAPFAFAVAYSLRARQIGQLEVSAPAVTHEGFPPVRNVVPLVLQP